MERACAEWVAFDWIRTRNASHFAAYLEERSARSHTGPSGGSTLHFNHKRPKIHLQLHTRCAGEK